MKALLNKIGELICGAVFMVGLATIYSYIGDRWPRPFWIVSLSGLSGILVWYLCHFFVVPFRQELHNSDKIEH